MPFVLFSYFNPVMQVGMETIFEVAQEADISGLIIPDLPLEEDAEVREAAARAVCISFRSSLRHPNERIQRSSSAHPGLFIVFRRSA